MDPNIFDMAYSTCEDTALKTRLLSSYTTFKRVQETLSMTKNCLAEYMNGILPEDKKLQLDSHISSDALEERRRLVLDILLNDQEKNSKYAGLFFQAIEMLNRITGTYNKQLKILHALVTAANGFSIGRLE
jgi:hypothetical protein